MKTLFQITPIPISGLMLAFVALGNLFHMLDYTFLGHCALFIGAMLFSLVLGKILFAWQSVVTEMQNPIIASVSPTFTMGMMALSNGLHHYQVSEFIIHSVWILAATAQILLIGYFIKTFIWRKKLTRAMVFPSWLILFVGTAMMPLTAGALSNQFTQGIVLFALIAAIVLVPIIILRGFIVKDLPEPTIPMLTILSAPASLCLAAYMKQFETNIYVVVPLFLLAILLFILVLTKLPSALQLPFYPSYAAFTFPLVVTATATHAVNDFFIVQHIQLPWLTWLGTIQLVLASLMVVYVLIRYGNYLTFQFNLKRTEQEHPNEATFKL